MKTILLLLGVLLMSFNLYALPKASDFKEVGGEDDTTAESSTKKTSQDEADSAKPPMGENEELVAGTVRVIRKINMTEVFFKDLKDSYFIPSGSKYSSIYKACQESEKKGTPVGLKVNSKSRQILSLESSAMKSPAAGGAESKTMNSSAGAASGGSK